mmetsp:Transcript_36455/g.66793  ORF Transcript_36455/g.66793 Transcript_36455/m.66793 type:complete len:130 (+) Transcript_36455:58-447(+)
MKAVHVLLAFAALRVCSSESVRHSFRRTTLLGGRDGVIEAGRNTSGLSNVIVDYSSLEPVHSALPSASQFACPLEEFQRYSTILCSAAFQRCTSDWCREWKAEWIKKFGACAKNGCSGLPVEGSESGLS